MSFTNSNIISISLGGLSLLISIINIYLIPFNSLNSKKFEKRLEFRFEYFQKVIELWEISNEKIFSKDKFELKMTELNKLVRLYGYKNEIQSFIDIINCYNTDFESNQYKIEKVQEKLSIFFKISFDTYRKELKLGKLNES